MHSKRRDSSVLAQALGPVSRRKRFLGVLLCAVLASAVVLLVLLPHTQGPGPGGSSEGRGGAVAVSQGKLAEREPSFGWSFGRLPPKQVSSYNFSDAPPLPPGPFTAFIGVFTTFNGTKYTERRQVVRETWFATAAAMDGFHIRFISGRPEPQHVAAVRKEQEEHGDIIVLDTEECYTCLANKTMTFFSEVGRVVNTDWVIKVDDDVFLMPMRLSAAMHQWRKMKADYVGCMKHGEVFDDPENKWYEPNQLLVGREYSMNAYGSIYALSGRIARTALAPNAHLLRQLANEDTTMGLWMLAFQAVFFEDMRLCAPRCNSASVAVLQQGGCFGLCNPVEEMHKLMKSPFCKDSARTPLQYMPSYPAHKAFEKMRV